MTTATISTAAAEKGGAMADPSAAVDDLARRRPSGDYEDVNEDGLKKKESLAARRYQTQSSAATDFDDDDDAATTDLSRTTTKSTIRKPWYRRLNPLRRGRKPSVPAERTVSPEYRASWLSKLTFHWMEPMMRVGYQRPLELKDVWLVNPNRSTEVMAAKLKTAFEKRVARGDRYPLRGAMHETFKREFWLGGFCQLMATILQVLTPYTLRYLIAFATEAYVARIGPVTRPAPPIGRGLGLAFGITAMQVLQSFAMSHSMYRGMIVGAQARAVLIAVIFEKSMRISGRAKAGGRAIAAVAAAAAEDTKADKKETGPKVPDDQGPGIAGDGTGWGNGKVVNLMATDTYRVDQASGLFHVIWTAPLAMLITLALLLVNLSYSALAGYGLLLLGTPVVTWAVKVLFARRAKINKMTDQRVSLTQEILQAVRFVKFFGWESSFMERLGAIRRKEIRSIQGLLAIRNAVNAVSMSLPTFASMLAFITYALTANNLTPARVFSSLALFNALRMPLNILPMVIGQTVDAWASITRIQEYLLAEEMKDEFRWDLEGKHAVETRDAEFTWERTATQQQDRQSVDESHHKQKKVKDHADKETKASAKSSTDGSDDPRADESSSTPGDREPFKLRPLNLQFGRNELVAVVGSVGSGKSSLLAALAGDMRKTGGEVVIGASRAFCPQYAWIQNASVKENVLFGKPFDEQWYAKVIDACALRPDLQMLPNGDATEIGERGITVSGGQKQRLNIARAIYFDADIVLMDDPLSAVDAHVGRHIFDHAIAGLLHDKCRVLATHQLHVLSRCDRIIWMQDGRVAAFDSYDNLMTQNEGFAKMMVGTMAEEEGENEAEGDASADGKRAKKEKKKKEEKPVPALMQAEERAVKSVPMSVYTAYVRSSGSLINGPLLVLLLVIAQGANIVTSLWLSYWISDKFGLSRGQYIGVYTGLGVVQALLMFFFAIFLTMLGTTASKVMMNRAMTRVLRAPMSFFDTTPLGRITNRFSKDVDIMDNNLTDSMRMYFFTLAMILSVFILIIAFYPFFTVSLIPLLVAFVFSTSYYRASARELKRHESLLRSVVFAKFSEALSGVACIRAYGLQDRFIHTVRDAIDNMDSAYYLTFSNQRWLSVRLDTVGNLIVLVTGILVVTSRFSVNPSIGGLVLSYILSITQMLQFTVRQMAEVENAMNATERIHYYGTQLEEEAPLHTIDVRPSWPEKGEIVFDRVRMRYRENLPLVLRDLSLHVRGGERIGVVGRTGAGKSSIMTTLFRLVELMSGTITIDGVDVGKIGLRDLRSRLSIIPQDPTLFRGTIRSNLDPFNEHTDLELWSALRQSDLVHDGAAPTPGGAAAPAPAADENAPTGRIHLDGVVEEEGMNFSLGQRQLMALARALVRGSQIIVCDEATSSVDLETDDKIQRTMATAFAGKTLLCIAHRLRTIIRYDRICVMDAGRIAELDAPLALFNRPAGIFRGMCDRSGIRREDFEAAEEE